mmetsp:Transcript_17803/g.38869  ORF Transcript_17803/g.38869 Transcript_17803/m.38869 type:complete len:80 (+) Transcript_17803:1831-2070(+)
MLRYWQEPPSVVAVDLLRKFLDLASLWISARILSHRDETKLHNTFLLFLSAALTGTPLAAVNLHAMSRNVEVSTAKANS